MSKPWDNEPTPIANLADHNRNYPDGFIPSNTGRYLERRMRHAERLLGLYRIHGATQKRSIAEHLTDFHLEAARREDSQ